MSVFTYLFEAKSIQSYLFRGGKLKDIIAASERLDMLIDDTEESVLSQVLESSRLSSDLHSQSQPSNNELIRFIRVKGGAFYAYCHTQAPLLQLRSSWSLVVQQLFPSLAFTDALTSAETLQEAIKCGHKKLAEDRNVPIIKFPLATAITERCPRTGGASVLISGLAERTSHMDKHANGQPDKTLDSDTELHRQAYQARDMKNEAALQDKFTPKGLKGKVKYPLDLDNDFQFASKHIPSNKEAIKDMAIIHIDGNGLGIILRQLQQALENASDDEYRETFRAFSSALSGATQAAAQQATQWLYDAALTDEEKQKQTFIPMRPIVLGGDDITLLCRADLALEYSKRFCIAFKQSSEQALKLIYLKLKWQKTQQQPEAYLTASGGILYHKSGHPFTHSHQLVEGLCASAKVLSKKVQNKVAKNVGPAALSFYRLSNAVSADVEQLITQSQCFPMGDPSLNEQMNLGFNTYLVERDTSGEACFEDIEHCMALSNSMDAAVTMSKWRNMATQLSLGNKAEAERLYSRALDISNSKQAANAKLQQQTLQTLSSGADFAGSAAAWYWQQDKGQLQTVISDLLIIDHFSGKEKSTVDNKKEARA